MAWEVPSGTMVLKELLNKLNIQHTGFHDLLALHVQPPKNITNNFKTEAFLFQAYIILLP